MTNPSPANLIVSEIQYNPVGGGQFEFIRVQNISASPVDIRKLKFTAGITFDFATGTQSGVGTAGTGTAPYNVPLTELAAGDSVYVVKSVVDFQARFGPSFDSKIAGSYGTTDLSNGGEQIKLDHVDGATVTVIKNFTYDDVAPWPITPDGEGPSLLLKDPSTNPDPGIATNWTASSAMGGINGRSADYASFVNSTWGAASASNPAISGPSADPDGDGFSNLLEYALNSNPKVKDGPALTETGRITESGQDYLTVSFTVRAGISGITVSPESSTNMDTWSAAGTAVVGTGTTQPDGSTRWTYRDTTPIGSSPYRHFLHIKVTSP